MTKRYKVSEIFFSFQGEAHRNGMPSIWVRFFGCNLKCDGFGQADPTNPQTYTLPRKSDFSNLSKVESLPVFSQGCDSAYSWAPEFKGMVATLSANEIVKKILQLKEEYGYTSGWKHPLTSTDLQLCFTGGEPMLQQGAMVEIFDLIQKHDEDSTSKHKLTYLTVESNATRPLEPVFKKSVIDRSQFHFALSPKLYSVSGEPNGFNKDRILEYMSADSDDNASGSIKFVLNDSNQAFSELERAVSQLGPALSIFKNWDVWVMPVGATVESQAGESISKIALRSLKMGMRVAARSHIQVFGNEVGR